MSEGTVVDRLEAGSRVWSLTAAHVLIGRCDEDLGIRPEVDLTGLDPERLVSRKHGALERGASGWSFRDLGSGNGSVVDGRSVTPGRAVNLGDRSRIEVGDIVLVLRLAPLPVTDVRGGGPVDGVEEDARTTVMGRRRLPAPGTEPPPRRRHRGGR